MDADYTVDSSTLSRVDQAKLIHYLSMTSSHYWLVRLMCHLYRSNRCFRLVTSDCVYGSMYTDAFAHCLGDIGPLAAVPYSSSSN